MRSLVIFITIHIFCATAQLSFLKSVSSGVTKEVATIVDPIEKTIVSVGFSQCKHVKRILGVDYDSYNRTQLNLDELTLNFITRSVKVQFKLTEAAQLIPASGWFNPRHPLKIYLHGFTDDPSKASYTQLHQAFLALGDVNIVALDASSLIHWLYLRSTTMVRYIGEQLGRILAALVYAGLPPSSIHLIGHSLGSHISGFAGKMFMSITGHRVGRISGLDPAGPCFSDVNATLRLNVNDADYVDVIHTDAGVYGLDEQIGHVDFYPNSGSQQPDCLPALLLATCSHSRAWHLFAESVTRPRAFIGAKCENWQQFRNGKCNYNDLSLMGYWSQPGGSGRYYLRTAEKMPYGLGKEGLKYVNNEGILKNIGYKITGIFSRKMPYF